MVVVLWVLTVLSVLLWLFHVGVFWCAWGRATIDKSAGLHKTLWMYTPWALSAFVWLLLSLSFFNEAHQAFFNVAPAVILMALSVTIVIPACRRLQAAERRYQEEIARIRPITYAASD